jgi:hypothetical protein
MRARLLLLLLTALLSGCSPGLVLHLYNATEDTLTVTNSRFRRAVTIPPHTAADIGISRDVLIRTSRYTWFYPQTSALPPTPLFQQHTMLWRAFGRIDTRGRIFVLAPPPTDAAAPREIAQPAGFPLQPRKRPNQAMQRTASKPATDVWRVCLSRFGCVAHCSGLAVADLVSR